MSDTSELVAALSRLTQTLSGMNARMDYENRAGAAIPGLSRPSGGTTLAQLGGAVSPEFGSLSAIAASAMFGGAAFSPLRSNYTADSFNVIQQAEFGRAVSGTYMGGLGQVASSLGLPNSPMTGMGMAMATQFMPFLKPLLESNPGYISQEAASGISVSNYLFNKGTYSQADPTNGKLGFNAELLSAINTTNDKGEVVRRAGFRNLSPDSLAAAAVALSQHEDVSRLGMPAFAQRAANLGREGQVIANRLNLDPQTTMDLLASGKGKDNLNWATSAAAAIGAGGGSHLVTGVQQAVAGQSGVFAGVDLAARTGLMEANSRAVGVSSSDKQVIAQGMVAGDAAVNHSMEADMVANIRSFGTAEEKAGMEAALKNGTFSSFFQRMKARNPNLIRSTNERLRASAMNDLGERHLKGDFDIASAESDLRKVGHGLAGSVHSMVDGIKHGDKDAISRAAALASGRFSDAGLSSSQIHYLQQNKNAQDAMMNIGSLSMGTAGKITKGMTDGLETRMRAAQKGDSENGPQGNETAELLKEILNLLRELFTGGKIDGPLSNIMKHMTNGPLVVTPANGPK